ncbi:MAG: hypothetical protein ABSG00_12130 [Terracidiphilus sp.]|jgi:hypothetical protein
MKFTKFGKALLMSTLSAGLVLCITSCVQSYSVGYLYVTGTVTAETSGSGIISGFKIDHNTGKLNPIAGLPISSGGANPVRALLLPGSRFFYVLNRGVNKEGNGNCTTADPCLGSNVTQFAVGANGILTAQETFYTQGLNPFRMTADSSGAYLYVLDHDSAAPSSTPANPIASSVANPNPLCATELGKDAKGNPITVCGDVTTFHIDSSTGRLSLVPDTVATRVNGSTVPYFPVPANSVDMSLISGDLLTLNAPAVQTQYPYTGGSSYFPYIYNSANGQLTVGLTTPQPLNITQGRSIVGGSGYVFVLDDEPLATNPTGAASQILPFTIGTNGSLQATVNGPFADDPNQSNPLFLLVENKGKDFYVANYGNNTSGTGTAQSGIAGFVMNSPLQPEEIPGVPIGFGSGGGPQCLVEDPSNQFIYTANFNDSTVTGQELSAETGLLIPLSQASKAPSSYSLTGPPTWCLVDGRTN